MNARRVNAAAGVVHAAMRQRETAAGIAAALEAAGLLQSPESAVELTRRRSEDLALRVELAPMGGPRAVPIELGESLLPAVRWLVQRVAELEAEAGDGHVRTVDEDPLPIALTQAADMTASQWATAIDAAGLRPGPAFAARYVTGEYDAAVHIATSPMLTDDARQELIEELGTAVETTINRVLCTRTVRITQPAPLTQTAAEVLAERSTPWVADLPAGPVLCRCGHTGADHHHAGRSCGAMLPRRHEPGGPWGPLEPCTCSGFAAGPSRGELAEQRHLLDPLDHRLERLAPGSGVTA